MAIVTEIKGNLFESGAQTLVNTVNCVGVMGKGIALEFKNRFPEMYRQYIHYCDQGQLQPGRLQLWNQEKPWILNFPTKKHWRQPSKIDYLESGLSKFAESYLERGISSIAFPRLGSSLGGLDWERQVRPLMYRVMEPLMNLEVEIYNYDPNARDSLFDKLYQKVHRFGIDDYRNYLGLSLKQSRKFMDGLDSGEVKSMMDLQEINGIGEKALEKIYLFAGSRSIGTIKTERDIQLSFL